MTPRSSTESDTWENIGWTSYVYNASYPGRVDHVYYSDETQEEYNWGSNCCGLESETDRYGSTTSYDYDEYGRVQSKTIVGATASGVADILVIYTYDGKGRIRSTKRKSNGGVAPYLSLSSSKTYDWKGRVLTSTDEQGLTTTTVYEDSARTVTTTYPSSTGEPRTRVVTKYRDGQIKSVTGTAVIEEHYTYGYGTGDDECGYPRFSDH